MLCYYIEVLVNDPVIYLLSCHLLLSSCDPDLQIYLNQAHIKAVLFKHILLKEQDPHPANSKLAHVVQLIEDIKLCTVILQDAFFIQSIEPPENADIEMIQVEELAS